MRAGGDRWIWRAAAPEDGALPLKPFLDCLTANREEFVDARPEAADLIDALLGGQGGADFERVLYRLADTTWALIVNAYACWILFWLLANWLVAEYEFHEGVV